MSRLGLISFDSRVQKIFFDHVVGGGVKRGERGERKIKERGSEGRMS